ncbi:iron chelate uptake ABC transporter family permease subunit, partial [Micrococcus luteus]
MSLQRTAAADVVARLRRSDRRRLGWACAGLAVAVLVLALLRVVWGTYQVTVPDLVRILGGETIPGASFIVLEEKLPRAVAAVLTGAALGAAGALYRRTLRNPLASPDILGVTQGAAAAVVLGMLVTAGQTGGGSDLTRAATALVGGLAAVVAVFATARSVGGERFVVAGIAVAAAGQAVVAGAMLSLAQHDLQSATVWIAGSLNGVTWGRIALLACVLVVALPLAGVLHARLAPADVGPDLAHALG